MERFGKFCGFALRLLGIVTWRQDNDKPGRHLCFCPLDVGECPRFQMLQNAVTAADVLSKYAQDIDERQKELLCEDVTEVSVASILVERECLC